MALEVHMGWFELCFVSGFWFWYARQAILWLSSIPSPNSSHFTPFGLELHLAVLRGYSQICPSLRLLLAVLRDHVNTVCLGLNLDLLQAKN